MPSYEQYVAEITRLKTAIKNVKNEEAQLKTRQVALASQPAVQGPGDLRTNLSKFIPKHLMPQNVGHYNKVSWPMWYSIDFDLGTNPVITNALRQVGSFQVTEEAAFIMYALSREAATYDASSDLGPLQIEFRDRQSSRFFNNAPLPIQMIGQRSWPTILPVPMLLMPNANFELTLSSWMPTGLSFTGVGSGYHQFTFHGIRIRIQDAQKVLGSIFG